MPDLSGLILLFWLAGGAIAMFLAALVLIPVGLIFAIPSWVLLLTVCGIGVVGFLASMVWLR